jgi:hypothetical protein
LVCTWQLNRLSVDDLAGLEISVLWYTEGKGDEDLSVHYFHRWSAPRLSELDLTTAQQFETRLPDSPLSYDGHLFRLRWCIRLRAFLHDGPELVTESPFRLSSADAGALPPGPARGASPKLSAVPATPQ